LSAIVHYSCVFLLTRFSCQRGPFVVLVLAGVAAFLLFLYKFVETGLRYRSCNFSLRDPACKEVLAVPYRPWLFEVSAALSQMATTPALMTWSAWQRYSEEPRGQPPPGDEAAALRGKRGA